MTHSEFKKHIIGLVEPLDFTVFWGTRSLYNAHVKQVNDKTLIIEPFVLPFSVEGNCHVERNVTFWIGMRRDLKQPDALTDGRDVDFMDELHALAKQVIDAINTHPQMIIAQKVYTIEPTYYEADETVTVNHQSFITFTVPLILWNVQ
jgi:hypothetical protein